MDFAKESAAFWLTDTIIACKFEKETGEIGNYKELAYILYYNPEAEIKEKNGEIDLSGKTSEIELVDIGDFSQDILPAGIADNDRVNEKYGLLKRNDNGMDTIGYFRRLTFKKTPDESEIKEMISGNLVIVAKKVGACFRKAILQKADIIDKYYCFDGELGVVFTESDYEFRLWAPTATEVNLHIYDSSKTKNEIAASPFEMAKGKDGVWRCHGQQKWMNLFYKYEVTVFSRHSKNSVIRKLVTDPYSVSLSTNGEYSQIVNLDDKNDHDICPENWEEHVFNYDRDFDEADINLYELHIRDFSAFDDSDAMPEQYRGKYKAFTLQDTKGISHLKELADAGLKYIHLLPVNDFSTVSEDEALDILKTTIGEASEYFKKYNKEEFAKFERIIQKIETTENMTLYDALNGITKKYGGASGYQYELLKLTCNSDKYNWGYDPYHFMVPDGSYALNSDGKSRIKEFREMIMAIHNNLKLRVVIDVVFNHTSTEDPLEWIVPDYYYRIEGDQLKPHCGFELALENRMVEKLAADSIYKWVKYYKIDGVRFDRMQSMTIESILKAKEKIKNLTDGEKVYFYGEGFTDYSLKGTGRFRNANRNALWNYPEEKIGVFNRFFRDNLRGVADNYNGVFERDSFIVRNGLSEKAPSLDKSNFIGYLFKDETNGIHSDKQFICPQSVINYVVCHDNGTLWDFLIAKTGFDRADCHDYPSGRTDILLKMNNIYVGIIALSQGIPFFYAGTELLRSKSGDFNSYNSGEWLNELYFPTNLNRNDLDFNSAFIHNSWGRGYIDNLDGWCEHGGDEEKSKWEARWKERLLKVPSPTNRQVLYAKNHFLEMLKIRKSTNLFRLRNTDEIIKRVSFPDSHDRDLFVMKIDGPDFELNGNGIYVLINNSWNEEKSFPCSEDVELHSVLVKTENTLLKEYYENKRLLNEVEIKDYFATGKNMKTPPLSIMVYIIKV